MCYSNRSQHTEATANPAFQVDASDICTCHKGQRRIPSPAHGLDIGR